jgi:serine/threonine-protein kinase
MAARMIAPGEVIAGKYRVQKILGKGGMGVVLSARDEDLARPVAVKQLLPEWASDKDCVARFLREARSMVRLTSEHTVRVYDAGQLPGGIPYMVMEYLTGQDLGAMLAQHGALPPQLAVAYVLQACEGLAEAHVSGIVHRDLKPPNLFVTKRPDGSDLVKVLDYGLAKATQDEAQLTKTSATLGSPLYLSPELLGHARHVDVRTDVWSLGVTLYELVTGRLPFVAPTIYEIFAAIQRDTPIEPCAIRPVPPELSAVIMRCLSKAPQARYKDVADLADALAPFGGAGAKASAERVRRVLETTTPFIRTPSDPPPSDNDTKTIAIYDSDPGKSRRRIVWAALSGAALSAAITGTVLLVRFRITPPKPLVIDTRPTPVPAGSIWTDTSPSDSARVLGASDAGAPPASSAAPSSRPQPKKRSGAAASAPAPAASDPYDHY